MKQELKQKNVDIDSQERRASIKPSKYNTNYVPVLSTKIFRYLQKINERYEERTENVYYLMKIKEL